MAAVMVLAAFAFGAMLFTVALFGLLLRAFIRLVFFPLFLLKWIVTGLVMLVVGPVLAIVGLTVAFAFALVLAIPLLPLLAVGTILWLVLRSTRRPAIV